MNHDERKGCLERLDAVTTELRLHENLDETLVNCLLDLAAVAEALVRAER
jgi:hypothetical protein